MENKFSGKYFQLTVCFNGFDPKMVWSENFHFKPFPDPRVKAEREREREREEEERVQSSNRAPIRRPQTELQFDDPHSTGLVDGNRADQAKIDSNATRSRLRHAISPSHPPHNLTSRSNPVASLSSFFSQFDRIWWIFFLGFVSFVFCCEILKYSQVYEPYQSIIGQERGRTHRDLNERRKIKSNLNQINPNLV